MQMTHIRLLVDNFAECFQFYRDVMGFTVQMGAVDEPTYAEFVPGHGGFVLALFGKAAMAEAIGTIDLPPMAPAQDRLVLCVAVDDVDGMAQQFRDDGVALITEPTDIPAWGLRAAHVRDPAGNLIEINMGLPTSD